MNEYRPAPRQLPSGSPFMDGGFDRPASDSLSLGQIFGVLRRRYRLILLMTVLGIAGGAYLAIKTPASYKAVATIRLAGERRSLTGTIEDNETPEISSRTMDPILSLAQGVRSQSVMGAVVDSLGLQLSSATPELGMSKVDKIWVNPQAESDTIQVTFYQNGVKAKLGNREARARYGDVLDLGAARFAITTVPDVPSAQLAIIPRQMAADKLTSGVLVAPRPGTDVIDVTYLSSNPKMSQRVVNTTVTVFKHLSILSAKEKSTRRREFLEGQLKQTDSMLTRAQAELAAFRSRQQLASTQGLLEAQQTSMLTLDTRRTELEADKQTFSALLAQLKKGDDASQMEAIRALASSPAMADNPAVSNYYHQLQVYQYKVDSMTTGPWKAAPTNPDLIQLQSLIASTKNDLKQAIASHVATIDSRIAALRNLHASTGKGMQALPAMAEEEARLTSRVQSLTSSSDDVRR